MSTGRVALIGAVLAVLVVVVIVALMATGVLGPLSPTSTAVARGPVLVALVLPDETGQQQPRVIDVYTRAGTTWQVTSVSPTLPATVSGTSGRTLADAYTFGGGAQLVRAYEELGRENGAAWVVIGDSSWSKLVGPTPLALDLPTHMEVYDGKGLTPFDAGVNSIPATQTSLVLDGAQYLSASQSATIRAHVGDALAARLRVEGAANVSAIQSDFAPSQLSAWIQGLGTPTRVAGD